MKQIVIFGADAFATLLYDYLKADTRYQVCAFTVDRAYLKDSPAIASSKLPLIAFDEIETRFSPEEYEMLVAVGYSQMNSIRQQKSYEAKKKGYRIASYQHPTALVLSGEVGEGTILLENATIGMNCSIGKGNILWSAANIAHHTKMGDYNFFSISVAVAGNVVIHDNCFFGSNCTIRDGVEVHSHSLIGAAAYLESDSQEHSVHVPARTVCLDKDSSEMLL